VIGPDGQCPHCGKARLMFTREVRNGDVYSCQGCKRYVLLVSNGRHGKPCSLRAVLLEGNIGTPLPCALEAKSTGKYYQMNLDALSPDRRCPSCGQTNLMFVQSRRGSDIYLCAMEQGGCERMVKHRRISGSASCGIATFVKGAQVGEWQRCALPQVNDAGARTTATDHIEAVAKILGVGPWLAPPKFRRRA